MLLGCIRLSLASLAMLLVSCAAPEHAATGNLTAYVDLQRSTVIAFIPTSMPASPETGASATRELVQAAIKRASACLGESSASYRLVYAGRIVVRASGREESFDIANLTPLVGALLLRPDANARILFAGGGPEALQGMLRRAVSDYFGRTCDD